MILELRVDTEDEESVGALIKALVEKYLLRGANLRGANLTEASLKHAKITPKQLSEIIIVPE